MKFISIRRLAARVCVAVLLAEVALGFSASAAELSPEQHGALHTLLVGCLRQLRNDADRHAATALAGLEEACMNSAYGRSKEVAEVRQRLQGEAVALKQKVQSLDQEIAQRGAQARQSGTMSALFAKEQSIAFQWYAWYRGVIELTNLAAVSGGRHDAALGALHTDLLRVHENTQKVLSETIQALGDKFP